MFTISPLKPLFQKSLTGIIAPHGITDIFHAQQYNLTSELYQVNGIAMLNSHVLHFTCPDIIISSMFLLSSIIHFRHDMPRIFSIPRYIVSASCISSFYLYPQLFFLYMLLIHVPNHYKMNWKYVKKNMKVNMLVLLLFTVGSYFAGNLIMDKFLNAYIIHMAEGTIIAHIFYEEMYIHKTERLQIDN